MLRRASFISALLACGCFGSVSDDSNQDLGSFADASTPVETPDTDPPVQGIDTDEDGIDDDIDNCVNVSNAAQLDADGDGAGNDCDCQPGDTSIGLRIFSDSLAVDRGEVRAAPGYPTSNWTFTSGELRQNRLVDNGADAIYFSDPLVADDFVVFVTGISTEIANFDSSDLRQLEVVLSSSPTTFLAVGCGIEVVEGLAVTQQTSIISHAGVRFSELVREDRAAVQVNEVFTLKMTVSGDTLACESTIGGAQVTAQHTFDPGALAGYRQLGFSTRETRATYRGLEVCAIP